MIKYFIIILFFNVSFFLDGQKLNRIDFITNYEPIKGNIDSIEYFNYTSNKLEYERTDYFQDSLYLYSTPSDDDRKLLHDINLERISYNNIGLKGREIQNFVIIYSDEENSKIVDSVTLSKRSVFEYHKREDFGNMDYLNSSTFYFVDQFNNVISQLKINDNDKTVSYNINHKINYKEKTISSSYHIYEPYYHYIESVFNFNKNGNLTQGYKISNEVFGHNEIIKNYEFEYEYDDKSNWITKTEIVNGELISTVKRKIYYSN